ncbi:Nup82 [Kluyveromyces lactis]|nr:Nup82 [Kluyveromyces lactis]
MLLFNTEDLKGIFQEVSLNPSNRLVCNNANTIYLWQDNILRVQSDHETQYKSYNVELPFVPEQMVISPSGGLVAFYANSEFYVVEVNEQARLRKHFNTSLGIKKLLWHPLATYGLSFVVLHDDGTIRIYDLEDLEPESITVFNRKSRSFGLSDHVESVCDIAFDPTGLTLYLLSSFNYCDIYAIHPCLPKNFSLRSNDTSNVTPRTKNDSLADYMLHKSLSLYNSLDKQLKLISGSDPDGKSDYLTLKHDLLKQIQFFDNYKKNDGIDTFSSKAIRNSVPQGPFIIKKFPTALNAKEVTGLTVIPVGERLGLLNLQFTDGANVVLFPDSEIVMCWTLRSTTTFNNLSVITTFNAKGQCQLLNSSEPKLVFTCDNSTTIVEMPWLEPLAQCIRLHDFSIIDDVKFENKVRTVPGTFLGVLSTLSGDILYNGNSFKVIESNDKSTTQKHINRTDEVKYTYKPSLPTSGKELDMLLKKYKTEANGFISCIPDSLAPLPLKNNSNERQLEVVSELYKETMKRIKLGQMILFRMFNKSNEEVAELHRQLRKTNEIEMLRNKLNGNLEGLQERYSRYEEKSKTLEKRLDKLKETFSSIENNEKSRTSSISEAELVWFKSIKNQVLKFNNYVHLTNKLREELEFLDTQLRSTTKGDDSFSELEFSSLQQMLINDKKIINSCMNELSASIEDLAV